MTSDAWSLHEPCAGSAAFSLHKLGATKAILPYQGSKHRLRHDLDELATGLGFEGPPSHVVLTDPGPWGIALAAVLDRKQRLGVADQLEALAQEDPRALYEFLQGRTIPAMRIEYTTEFLFLQRLSFSGKAVGVTNGRWSSPGFNTSSAYGIPATNKFGQVKPMVPSLVKTLRRYELHEARIEVRQEPAALPTAPVSGPTLVYLDPPYDDSTDYPDGSMNRGQVIELAQAWHDAGASVIVSEQHELPELEGWERRELYRGRRDTSPFRSKRPEWVTYKAAA